MVTEDYISFEIAKLLKEKGFDIQGYASTKVFGGNTYEVNGEWITPKEDTIIPTLQMAMKWLREKEIFVEITHGIIPFPTYKYHYSVFCTAPEFYYSGDAYDSYEEACEAGIRYSLENLI